MVNIGVIGCGHWGPNHIRIFSHQLNSRVLMCADVSEERLKSVKNLYPHCEALTDYHKILENKDIQAVCVASPTNTHYAISRDALLAQKHVLCENRWP